MTVPLSRWKGTHSAGKIVEVNCLAALVWVKQVC